MHLMFMTALSTIAKLWKEHKCPSTDEWIKKMWSIYLSVYLSIYTHIHNRILLSHLNEVLPFATIWMELESIMLSEISQREKDKYHMISLMWNLRDKTDEHRGRGKKRRK